MSSDIIDIISSEGSAAVNQIIEDSGRLHTIVNGTGVESATTEDGSLIPSVRKALVDNLYFKSPALPWSPGSSVSVFNQLYSYTDGNGVTEWWYAPSATSGSPVTMQQSPVNDSKFRLFLNGSNITYIYAPLNSPDLTGNPRTPTPAAGDASTSIANTQWVSEEIEALKEELDGNMTGTFEDITITGEATVKTLHVEEQSKFDGPIDASKTTMSLNKLSMVGQDAEISFDESGPAPSGITEKTSIKPFSVTTGEVDAEVAEFDKLTVLGVQDETTVSTDLQGNVEADYVHITGNANSNGGRPQLIVDGIAKFGTIIADNIQANVDGLDIHPNSVVTDEDIAVGKDLSVGGVTTVNNLVINGTVEGLDLSVDGKDIHPKSVTTDTGVAVGTDLTVAGNSTLKATSVTSLTASGQSTLQGVNAQNITATGLNVNGNTNADKIVASRIEVEAITLSGTDLVSPFTPAMTTNMYNLVIDKNVVINTPDLTGINAFTMNIYLRQDATGNHAVTLGTGYTVLNPDVAIPVTANSVTILQLSYSGFSGDKIDVAIFVRP